MPDEARSLKAQHAETPVEATERRRELLTAYLKQLREDRRKREDTGIKTALEKSGHMARRIQARVRSSWTRSWKWTVARNICGGLKDDISA